MTVPAHAISVVLADDHPILLQGLIDLLATEDGLDVVASCSEGLSALQAIRELKPEIAVLDIAMPGASGLDVLAAVGAERCETKVILLTAEASDNEISAAASCGASGLILKDATPDELIQCVRDVAGGRRCLASELVDGALKREAEHRLAFDRAVGSTTPRERQIMLLVAEGLSNKWIGRYLKLSEGTVKVHLHNIYQKIGVANRTALAALALAHKEELAKRSAPVPPLSQTRPCAVRGVNSQHGSA